MKRILLLLLIVFSYSLQAQIPDLKWLKTLPFGVKCQVIDSEDNIYIAGDFSGTIVFDSVILTSNGTYPDIIVIKYDSSGNLLWYKQIGGLDGDWVMGLKIDNNNDLLLTNCFNYNTIIEGDTISHTGGHCPLIIKYSKDGDYIWSMIPVYSESCFHPRLSSIDNENNFYVYGTIFPNGNVIFPDTIIADSMGIFSYVAKYNSDGAFKWARGFNNDIYQMTNDRLNNLLLIKRSDTSGNDFIKLSPDGDLIWNRQIFANILGYDYYIDCYIPLLLTDRFCNIYYAGYYSDTLVVGDETFISKGNDIILIKNDSSGYPVWAISAGSPKYSRPKSLFVKDDHILMTGTFAKKIFFNTDSIVAFEGHLFEFYAHGFIVQYDLNGQNEVVKKVIGKKTVGASTDFISVNESLYVSGWYSDSTYFGNYLCTLDSGNNNYYNYKRNFLARFYNDPPTPEIIVDEFEIYPNPSKGMVNFNFNPSLKEATLELYNLKGSLVKTYSLKNTHNSIDLSYLNNGLYIVKLISGITVYYRKVVIL